jgi:hypothetical protein
MHDVTLTLGNRPGALAEVGEALGAAGISIEGGGVFATGGTAVAHFLFDDGEAAARVLAAANIRVEAVRPVVITRLQQAVPGQLGRMARRMADAGVNIEVQYSDHANRLILVVDDPQRAQEIVDASTGPEEPSRRT